MLIMLYIDLPETPLRPGPQDQSTAHRLYQQGVPLSLAEGALLLASLRRLIRNGDLPPLAPIRSLAGSLRTILSREPLPEDWREDIAGGLDVIASRSDSLNRFMAAYANLARLPKPTRIHQAIGPLVERVASLEQREAVRILPGPYIEAEVDADQIEQVLVNLVKNAVEAVAETGGQVSVTWEDQGPHFEITVLDEGPGISGTKNLFVPFFTTKPKGSGIGLVLSRQIAEAHGGVLTLENRADRQGCAARLILPKMVET
jgi:nitrogen fixation/metabolism regulation signal transduction histidine kinase